MTADPLRQPLTGALGDRTAGQLKRAFGMRVVGDLLGHLPRRYAKRGELTAIEALPVGENVTIVADVVDARERPMRGRRGSLLEVRISDGRGIITLTFFNQAWRAKDLRPGARGMFAGKTGEYRGQLQLAHPDYELFEDDGDGERAAEWASRPIPVYPATAQVSSWQVQRSVAAVLDALDAIPDPMPRAIAEAESLMPLDRALRDVHRPVEDADWARARATLRFHEALVLQVGLVEARERERARPAVARVPAPGGLLERFDAALPFALTGDQRAVGAEIAADIAEPHPMNRLVQGEVGSGKTLVALRAMLAAAESGGQSALLAPTEVLAQQHLRSLVRSLGPDLAAEVAPVLITGSMGQAERRRALLRVVAGQARIVVGTHAILGDAVSFLDLALVVIDEQHRFGVEQREALRSKAAMPPHVLVLTATPIPRTVAMTVFGDLEVSTIRELPAGRAGIESFVVPLADRPGWLGRVWARVREEVDRGRQAFVVCPAVEPGVAEDTGGEEPEEPDEDAAAPRPLASVAGVLAELAETPALAGLRIAGLHGRMRPEEKDAVMAGVQAGEVDVVVATTVIEVGVDVPNASTMVVLDADRFGVSQLHQLRGRVGRGGHAGLCLLVTGAEDGTPARERVEAVASTLDGFELAQVDLEQRREGDVLGSAQSGGRSGLRVLRVASDGAVIERARRAAVALLGVDPGLAEHAALRAAIDDRLAPEERAALRKT